MIVLHGDHCSYRHPRWNANDSYCEKWRRRRAREDRGWSDDDGENRTCDDAIHHGSPNDHHARPEKQPLPTD